MKGYEITAAREGGYVVRVAWCHEDMHLRRDVLFAGALEECLKFIAKQFMPLNPVGEPVA